MKALGTFLLFVSGITVFMCYTYLIADLGRQQGTRTMIDKDLCYPINSEQGGYVGFKLKLDKGYTAYICDSKVKE